MDLILVNFFMLTVFAKTLGSVAIFGLNFAPWDLFLLYPLVRRKLFYRYYVKRIHIALYFFCALLLSTLFNFSKVMLSLVCSSDYSKYFHPRFVLRIKVRFTRNPYNHIYYLYAPLFHLLAYYSPLQQMISEPSIGNFMRLEGFVGDANFFAFSILLLGLSVTKYRTLILFMILPCILLSGSRSGLGIWFILFYLRFRNYRLYLFTGFVIALIYSKDFIFSTLEKYENFSICSLVRFMIFPDTILDRSHRKFDDQFLFGNGPKSFAYDIGNFSHNDFITSYYEYGILGFVTFTLLIFSLVWLPSDNRFGRNLDLQIAYLSVLLILNLFSFWLFPHIWVLQGVLIGIYYTKISMVTDQLANESLFSGFSKGKRTVI